jgi:uncharacterized protein (TIGR00369 family)
MNSSDPTSILSPTELNQLLSGIFPGSERLFSVDSTSHEGIVLRCKPTEKHLRPGGTVSGPLLMAMADTAMYLAIFSRLGLVTMAVTTNLNINFLRKAPHGELVGKTRILKIGSRLAVGDVTIYPAIGDEPVAHASVTYSIPPRT